MSHSDSDSKNTPSSWEPLVDEFDRLWQAALKDKSARPKLYELLARVPENAQAELLCLLAPIEHECRLQLNELLQPERDYPELSAEQRQQLVQLWAAPVEDETLPPQKPGAAPRRATQRTASSQTIGPYKLLQKLGEGGMGEVWMAEQSEPVRRRVALKLIKAGLDNKQVLARFEAERQALAMMDHQNIARVLDAGATPEGAPYFVMELVQGIPFNQYCDQHKLSIDQRLELFLPVCAAVQHAHQKGIIHRDLKPSNVLVCLYDGKPVPKVIDFGLAKALQATTKLTDKTMFTEFGQVVGTLQYMSPEQAEMNQLDIDTRTDIYSLGVMLYELLTGSTPIDQETMRRQAILQVLEAIRVQEPPRPSARLSSATQEAASGVSQQRQIDPSRLKSLLRGELDWIVMKALEKDRTRRYETASRFGEDIQRYLSGDVVTARPPSIGYRLGKILRKYSAVRIAALFVILAILLGSQIHKARPLWNWTANLLNVNFGPSIFERADDFRKRLAAGDFRPGEIEESLSIIEKKLEVTRANLGPDHPDTLTGTIALAFCYKDAGKKDYALMLCEEAIPKMKIKLGTDHWATLRCMEFLTSEYYEKGDMQKTIEFLEQVIQAETNLEGRAHPNTQYSIEFLGKTYIQAERIQDAIPLLEEASRSGRESARNELRALFLKEKMVNQYSALAEQEINEAKAIQMILRGHSGEVLNAAFSPDGTRIVSGSRDCTLKIWDAATGKELNTLLGHTFPVLSVAFSPDGTKIVSGSGDRTLRVWDAVTGAQLQTLRGHADEVSCVAFSPEGQRIVSGSKDYELKVWDTATGRVLCNLTGNTQPVSSIAFNPDGKRIMSGSLSGTIKLWDADTGKELLNLKGHSGPVWAVAFSPDGEQIISGGGGSKNADNVLKLWDSSTGKELLELKGHSGVVLSVAFKPVHNEVISGSADKTLKVWDISAGTVLHTLRSQFGNVSSVAFSPDGTQILSGNAGGTLTLWAAGAERDLPLTAEMASVLVTAGADFLTLGENQRAEELLEEAFNIRKQVAPDLWNTFNAQSLLGGAKLAKAVALESEAETDVKAQLLSEAEPLLVQAYEGLKQRESTIPPEAPGVLPKALDRLIELYTALENSAEAIKYRELRIKYAGPTQVDPKNGK